MEQHKSRPAERQRRFLGRRPDYGHSAGDAAHGVRRPYHVLKVGLFVVAILAPCLLWADSQTEITEHARRAAAAIRTNQADVAVAELEAWLKLDPTNVNARANLGMVTFTQGNYNRSAQEFKTALALSPSLWSAKAFLGMCQLRLGATNQARELLEASLPHVSDNTLRNQAGLELIRSYANTGEASKALPAMRLLEEHDPANPEIQYSAYQLYSALAAGALEKLSAAGQDSARVHQVLAQSAMTQERYAQAVQEYSTALARDPRLPGLHFGMGEALLAEDHGSAQRQKAATEFAAELQIDPANADAAYQLARLSYEDSDFSAAKKWLTQAITLRPVFADAHVLLGQTLARTGDDKSALAEFTLAAKQAPDNRMAHYHLAQLYKKAGRTSDADRELALFRKLLASQAPAKPSVETP